MVVTKLIGGLGNQMFQYATGRRLAHVLRVDLKLDTLGFDTYSLRRYSLGNFNIKETFASLEEVTALTKPPITQQVLAKLRHRSPRPPPTYIREKHFHFDPEVLTLPGGVYLDGYWQSEKYFVDIAEIIRREFTVKSPQTGKTKELAEMITSTEAVSLHIRRGDYAIDPRTNQVHGLLPLDYYYQCVQQLTKVVKNPHFFIFSKEPQWARRNLSLSYPVTFVEHDGNGPNEDTEDLRLMSQCNHHIIANSSFSWWGAWLNSREDKIVFAPKQWFSKQEQVSRVMDDLLPANWVAL